MQLLVDSSLVTISSDKDGQISIGSKEYLDTHSWLLGLSRTSNNHLGGDVTSTVGCFKGFENLLPIRGGANTLKDYTNAYTYGLTPTKELVNHSKVFSNLEIRDKFHDNWASASCGTRYEYLGPFNTVLKDNGLHSLQGVRGSYKKVPLYLPVGSSIPSELMDSSEVLENIMEILDCPTSLTVWILGDRKKAIKCLGKNLAGIREVVALYYDIVIPKVTSFPIPFLAVSGTTPEVVYRKVISYAQDCGFRKMQNLLYLLESSRVFSRIYLDSDKRLKSSGGIIDESSRPFVKALSPLPTLKGSSLSDGLWPYILTISRIQESKGIKVRRTEKEMVSSLLIHGVIETRYEGDSTTDFVEPLELSTILYEMETLHNILKYFSNYINNFYEPNLLSVRSIGNSYGLATYKRGLKEILPTGSTYPKRTVERRLLHRIVSDFKSMEVDLLREHFSVLLFCLRVSPLLSLSGPARIMGERPDEAPYNSFDSNKSRDPAKRLLISKILSLDTLCYSKLVKILLSNINVSYNIEEKALDTVTTILYPQVGLESLPKLVKNYSWALKNNLLVRVSYFSGTDKKTLDLQNLLKTLILRYGFLVRQDLDTPELKKTVVSYFRGRYDTKNLDSVVEDWLREDIVRSHGGRPGCWADSLRFNKDFYALLKVKGVGLDTLLMYWRTVEEFRPLVKEWLPEVLEHASNLVHGYAAKTDGYTSRSLGMFFIDLTRTITEMQDWYQDNT